MSATYTLAVGGIDPDSASTFIIAYFDNGTWVSCRVINDQLSFCADASPPYTSGFAGIIAGDPRPQIASTAAPRRRAMDRLAASPPAPARPAGPDNPPGAVG